MRRADKVQGEKEIGWDEGLFSETIVNCCKLLSPSTAFGRYV